MSTLQHDQAPLDAEIASELIACLPEAWSQAQLVVERVSEGGRSGHRMGIRSPQPAKTQVRPSAELQLAVRKLDLLFQRHGHPWESVQYAVTLHESGNWKFEADFSYPD